MMQESEDEFQILKDQLTTYSYSTQVAPNSVFPSGSRAKRKIQQKPIINIISVAKPQQVSRPSLLSTKPKAPCFPHNKTIKLPPATFSSNFQSGNLLSIIQSTPSQYIIETSLQSNSNRSSSWFYFKCQGLKGQIQFVIKGFSKSTSLFSQGMKVCYREGKAMWKRGATKITYQQDQQNQLQTTYQLRFTYYFRTTDQLPVEFAYSYPYQYTRLLTMTKTLSKSYDFAYESIGKTYQGRQILVLTIGNENAQKSIILSARVHPGQTVSSFIIQGFIKQLLLDNQMSIYLREKFLFKIVPMINPDGVVNGNYRFSGAGYDLNRKWKHTYQSSHPQIHFLKNMVKKINKQKKVLMYIDIHGHSRKKNVFFYGCKSDDQTNQSNMFKTQQFPLLMEKINPNFRYDYCSFSMTPDKQGTARIQMWKQLKTQYVYTLQSSFCGPQNGLNYVEQDYLKIGKSLMEGISIFFYEKPQTNKHQLMKNKVNTNERIKNFQNSTFNQYISLRDQAKNQLQNSPQLRKIAMNDNQSGSDSQPEAGIIPEQQRLLNPLTLSLNIPSKQNLKKDKSEQFRPIKLQISKNYNKIHIRTTPNRLVNGRDILPQQIKNMIQQKILQLKEQCLPIGQIQGTSKKINNFYPAASSHLQQLNPTSLCKQTQRVHSKQLYRSPIHRFKNPRLNSQNPTLNQTQSDELLKAQQMQRNLLKTQQGVQYRRVKIVSEEIKRKAFSLNRSGDQMGGVNGGMINQGNYVRAKKIKTITPSFYPQYQQKAKRFSIDSMIKRHGDSVKLSIGVNRLFINGNQLSVLCKGTRIYI